jgi:hypothetical protein
MVTRIRPLYTQGPTPLPFLGPKHMWPQHTRPGHTPSGAGHLQSLMSKQWRCQDSPALYTKFVLQAHLPLAFWNTPPLPSVLHTPKTEASKQPT